MEKEEFQEIDDFIMINTMAKPNAIVKRGGRKAKKAAVKLESDSD